MDRTQQFSEIRALVSQAKKEEALQQLVLWLEKTPGPLRQWMNTVILLRARLERLEHDERSGTVDYGDAQRIKNQITQDLLEVVDKLERGVTPPPEATEPLPRGRLLPWLAIGGLVTGLAALILFFIFKNGPDEDGVAVVPEPEPAGGVCPGFEAEAVFRILVLPFNPLSGDPSKIHEVIRNRLASQTESSRINASIKSANLDLTNMTDYPASGGEAERFGRPCGAQLVIYGLTEQTGGRNIILTRYKFIESAGYQFARLQFTENAEVDTVSTLSAIFTEGVLTQDIEANIRLLFGIIANQTNNDQLAIQQLEGTDIPEQDSMTSLFKSMVLADSYLKNKQEDKALETYNEAIEEHPNYFLARNNRALLLYKQGKYEAAAEDLDVAVEQNPRDTAARAARAAANIKAGRLDKARVDMQIRRPSGVRGTNILRSTEEKADVWTVLEEQFREAEAEQVRSFQAAETRLSTEPNNLQALEQKATTARNLGYYNEAMEATRRLLSIDRDNVTAFATKADVQLQLKDTAAAQRTIRDAQQARVDTSRLIRVAPALRSVLPERREQR